MQITGRELKRVERKKEEKKKKDVDEQTEQADTEIRYFETRTQQLALETASRNFRTVNEKKKKKEKEKRGKQTRDRANLKVLRGFKRNEYYEHLMSLGLTVA